MKYRAEIDGVRAIAVFSVILDHAGLSILKGGFLGVDVFFVLSGYLITRLIVDELEEGRFSILNFYDRRIRRILPALVALMIICTPIAYCLMIPDDLENYGQSLVATALSANNILLYLTSGYFEMNTEFKPLMHTWSLGVEEHYYIAVPFVMMTSYALARRKGALIGVTTLSILSFAACLWLSTASPNANFYLIFSRAWELGAGSIAAMAEPAFRARIRAAPARNGLALTGLALIVGAVLMIPADASLPNWPTLIPVLGTCLIVLFGSTEGAAGRLLASKPLVFTGLISYSLYLYHQPAFAFARIASLEEPTPVFMLALTPAIFAAAYLSWRYVETPFRNRRQMPSWQSLGFVAVGTACTLAIGLTMHFTSGFYASWPELAGDPEFGAKQNIAFNMGPFRYLDVPFSSNPATVKVLVLGNSFARDFINMGNETGSFSRHEISYSSIDDCTPTWPAIIADKVRVADFVVMGSGVGPTNIACFKRQLEEIRDLSKAQPIILGTKNFGWNNNALMRIDEGERYNVHVSPVDEALANNRAGSAAFPQDIYVNVLAIISDANGQVPVFTPDRKFISQDRGHLTKAGARYVGSLIFQHPALQALSKAHAASG